MLANSTAVLYNSAMYKQNDISTSSEKTYAFRFIDGLGRYIGCRTPHICDYIISYHVISYLRLNILWDNMKEMWKSRTVAVYYF